MKFCCNALLPDECEHLIAALRRDIQSERIKAIDRPEWSSHHIRNVRLSIRLLEAFGHREDYLQRSSHENSARQNEVPGLR